MAELKNGTTIGGAVPWTKATLNLIPSGDSINYKGYKIYTENDKPTNAETDTVSASKGGDYTGLVNFNNGIFVKGVLSSGLSITANDIDIRFKTSHITFVNSSGNQTGYHNYNNGEFYSTTIKGVTVNDSSGRVFSNGNQPSWNQVLGLKDAGLKIDSTVAEFKVSGSFRNRVSAVDEGNNPNIHLYTKAAGVNIPFFQSNIGSKWSGVLYFPSIITNVESGVNRTIAVKEEHYTKTEQDNRYIKIGTGGANPAFKYASGGHGYFTWWEADVRQSYLGFSSNGSTIFKIVNEKPNADLELGTNGTGRVTWNGKPIVIEGKDGFHGGTSAVRWNSEQEFLNVARDQKVSSTIFRNDQTTLINGMVRYAPAFLFKAGDTWANLSIDHTNGRLSTRAGTTAGNITTPSRYYLFSDEVWTRKEADDRFLPLIYENTSGVPMRTSYGNTTVNTGWVCIAEIGDGVLSNSNNSRYLFTVVSTTQGYGSGTVNNGYMTIAVTILNGGTSSKNFAVNAYNFGGERLVRVKQINSAKAEIWVSVGSYSKIITSCVTNNPIVFKKDIMVNDLPVGGTGEATTYDAQIHYRMADREWSTYTFLSKTGTTDISGEMVWNQKAPTTYAEYINSTSDDPASVNYMRRFRNYRNGTLWHEVSEAGGLCYYHGLTPTNFISRLNSSGHLTLRDGLTIQDTLTSGGGIRTTVKGGSWASWQTRGAGLQVAATDRNGASSVFKIIDGSSSTPIIAFDGYSTDGAPSGAISRLIVGTSELFITQNQFKFNKNIDTNADIFARTMFLQNTESRKLTLVSDEDNSNYISFHNKGSVENANRTAYIGFGDKNSNYFTISNDKTKKSLSVGDDLRFVGNKVLDTTDITQTSGTSTTQVPSQNAVSIWMNDRYTKSQSDNKYVIQNNTATIEVRNNSGITITGTTDYAGLNIKKPDGRWIRFETNPHGTGLLTIVYREANGSNNQVISVPNKSGTLAITSEHYTKSETDINIKNAVQGAMSINAIYPIGIVTWFAQNKNPNTLFPNTKWQYIGENKTIRLAAASGANVLTTGGSDSVTLSEAQMPSHNHSFSATTSSFDYGTKTTNTTGSHVHGINGEDSGSGGSNFGRGNGNARTITGIKAAGDHAHTVAIGAHTHTVSGTTGNKGGNTAINITNAYIMLMAWYRIS